MSRPIFQPGTETARPRPVSDGWRHYLLVSAVR